MNVFDFGDNPTRDDLINFNYVSTTKFEEIFSPSDNMLEETARYMISNIPNTKFTFTGCSYAESVDMMFRTEDGQWAIMSVEEQSIRMLAPTDPNGEICSFKGIAYYPFKLTPNQSHKCMHKFTEEPVEIAAPRKLITLSYTGRVDIFEVFFKDITEYKDKDKSIRSLSPNSKIDSPKDENKNFENAPAKKAKIEQNIIDSDAKKLAPKNIGSIFSSMDLSEKPAFLSSTTDSKKKIENKPKEQQNPETQT